MVIKGQAIQFTNWIPTNQEVSELEARIVVTDYLPIECRQHTSAGQHLLAIRDALSGTEQAYVDDEIAQYGVAIYKEANIKFAAHGGAQNVPRRKLQRYAAYSRPPPVLAISSSDNPILSSSSSSVIISGLVVIGRYRIQSADEMYWIYPN
jgi:hypothetical protein